MKLYTEEQVKRAIHIKSNNIDLLTSDDILDSLTPIELPSEEEIKNEAKKYTESTLDNDPIRIMTFIQSAKWVIEQIKQQGK